MAPRAWLKRLCSAPGKTRKVRPSWWMKRRRWSGRLPTSAASSGSARMKPWTGSRSESTGGGTRGSVERGARGEVPVGAQQVDDLPAAAQDLKHRKPALGQGLGEQLELARRRQ